MNAAKFLLVVAWLMAVFSVYRFAPILNQSVIPRLMSLMAVSGILGCGLYYLGLWMSVVPTSFARLSSPEGIPSVTLISVTGFSIDPKPYEVGKILHVNMRVNSLTSGLKIKGGFKIWTGTADDAALELENRQRNEERLWQEFAATPPTPKIAISFVRGDAISICDGPVLTKQQTDWLNDANGIVFIVGQLDYGEGALDFGGYIRTANPQIGILTVDHNGPAGKRFYQTKQL